MILITLQDYEIRIVRRNNIWILCCSSDRSYAMENSRIRNRSGNRILQLFNPSGRM